MILARQVEATGAKGGMAIVSDPATGEILALASVGRRRPGAPAGVGISTKNTAVTDNYEPGSVKQGHHPGRRAWRRAW